MVGLPYFHTPTRTYDPEYKPWSDFHTTSTLLVLLFSAVGLIFMGTYYFFFHGAKETISDTNLTWLAKVCEWTKRTSKRGQPFRVGLYKRQSNASTPTSFTNPLCADLPQITPSQSHTHVTAQPPPITNNVTSPLWTEPPQYHSLYPSRSNGKNGGNSELMNGDQPSNSNVSTTMPSFETSHMQPQVAAMRPLALEYVADRPSVLCGEEISD